MPTNHSLSGDYGGLPIAPWQQVDRGLNIAYQKAEEAFALATDYINALTTFQLQPITTNVSITPPTFSTGFQRPAEPTAPDLEFDPSVLVIPAGPTLTPAVLDGATDPPVFDGVRPSVDFSGQPAPLSESAPGNAPSVGDIAVSAAPTVIIPDVPSLVALNLPIAPTVILPTFSGTSPTIDFIPPGVDFSFYEAPYSSTLLDEIKAKVSVVLAGGSGLTPAIENAIWERARERETATAKQAAEQAMQEFSARGFAIPPGMLSGRLAEIQQANQSAANALSREQAIKSLEIQLEQLKSFVQYGIQLESVLMDMAQRSVQRAFEAARFTHEAAIQIYDARVRLFSAQLQKYQVEAQVFGILVDAEIKKLEKYRIELEGQKLIGQLNQQTLETYNARIKALLSAVEIYRAQMDGVRAQVEVEQVKLAAFKTQVDTYVAKVQAKGQEYAAWEAKLRAETTKQNIYEADARVYAELVRAHGQTQQTKIEAARLTIENNRQQVEQYRAQLQVAEEKIRGESARIAAGTQIYDGQTRMFSALVGAEEARVRADVSQAQIALESSRANAQLAIENARLQIQQASQLVALQLEALKGATAAAAQLAGSSLAAINVQATVQGSSSYNENLALG